MKLLLLGLLGLLTVLQYKLWFAPNGMVHVMQQKRMNTILTQQLHQQQQNNQRLLKRIIALRTQPEIIEDLARRELGMIKTDEVFYQITPFDDTLKNNDN